MGQQGILGIVVHALTAETCVGLQLLEVTSDGAEFLRCDVEGVALVQLACYGGGVARPGSLIDQALLVFAELTEVARCRYPALVAGLRLIIDVEGAIVIGKDYRLEALWR